MSDPLTRLVELTVFAPIGLAAAARERLPEYVEEGRARVEQRLTLARFIGQMVVTQGRRELERRLAPEPPPAPRLRLVAEPAPDRDAGSSPAPASEPTGEQDVDPGVAGEIEPDDGAEPEAASVVPTAESLPIEAYESLAAAQVVARLGDLDDDGLDEIERFERAHRNRRTVLNRIGQLRRSS